MNLAALHMPRNAWEWMILAGGIVAWFCTVTVFAAILGNFVMARNHPPVSKELRSPVATLTMTGFFVLYALLLVTRSGSIHGLSLALRGNLAIGGALLMTLGCTVNVLGRLRLGSNWADQVTLYEAQNLVTTGVFAWVRHPLYASLIWMFFGGSLLYANWLACIANMFIFIPAMVFRARQEERLLEARFPEYLPYRRKVGMLFPKFPFNRSVP